MILDVALDLLGIHGDATQYQRSTQQKYETRHAKSSTASKVLRGRILS